MKTKQTSMRLTAYLLALILIVSAVSGCRSDSGGSSPGTQSTPAGEYPQRPALWEVTSDDGGTIYLFGSIHAAEEDLFPMDQAIMDMFESCDALAVEVDVLAYTEDPAKAMELSSYMVYMDGRAITDEIDEELFARVQTLLETEGADLGVPMDMAVMFRPYTFISLLTGLGVEKAGLSADLGVDMHFLELARESGMEILEVETMESQLDMFNSFSPEVLTYLLEEALDIEASGAGVRELYQVWKAGDLDSLVSLSESSETPDIEVPEYLEEYNQALLTDRNAGMSDAAEQYLLEGRRVFYVVGALHMVGEDGIVQQLLDRGYAVTRI